MTLPPATVEEVDRQLKIHGWIMARTCREEERKQTKKAVDRLLDRRNYLKFRERVKGRTTAVAR